MAGIYGSDPEDRYFERMLHDYLETDEEKDARQAREEARQEAKLARWEAMQEERGWEP